MEETLWLRMELPSRGVEERSPAMEKCEIEDAADASPLPGISFPLALRSGNREWTRVAMSDGHMTKKGWTSTVSFGDVTAFAGIKTGLAWSRGRVSLSRIVLTCCLTSGITTTEYRLESLAAALDA
jgi:hypothetical protein